MKKWLYHAIGLAIIVLAIASGKPAQAESPTVTRQYVHPVRLLDDKGKPYARGSAVVIHKNFALTAHHVVYNRTSNGTVAIQLSNRLVTAQVAAEQEHHDLALLKGDFGCPCAPLGVMPVIDAPAVAVGYPQPAEIDGTQWLSRGYIQNVLWKSIYSDTFVEKGNSGGGLFVQQEGRWRLVGITVQILGTVANTNRQGVVTFMHISHVTISTPISQVREFLQETVEWRQ